mmetsp:Transcript_11904/g.46122  ORF Transcript_11904/g.46122 Transcript_11904/m.46122 type:complete len:335 (-) Transcript_11904:423-1427(-)
MRSMPAYGKIPTSDGVRPLNKPFAPSALSTPAITVAIEMFPPAVSATRVLTISSGYTTVCAAAPAIPPAANRSSTVALPGSDANADFKASNATYLVAVSGTTLATLAAFPRQNAAHPPSLHTARAALASVTRGVLCGEDAADADTAGADGAIPELGNRPACMMVLILSIGAVAVRETAPATPPLASFFAVPMVSPLPPPSPSVAFAASSPPAASSPAAASSSSPPPREEPDSASDAAASSPTRHVATGVALDWSHLHTAQSSPPDTTSLGLWSRNAAPAAMFSWPFFSVLTSAPPTDVSSPTSTTTISPPSSAAHMRRPFLSTHTELTSSLLNA